LVEDDSPYPEVRSAVANTDDPSIPASSLRAWVLGMCELPTKNTGTNVLDLGLALAILLAGLNQFFFFRYPSVSVSGYVAVLLSLPMGRAWAAVRFHAVRTNSD
jgi:hypothetical protein